MGATNKSKRQRWNEVTKKTKDCPRCPPHKKENKTRHRPRTDKYKSKRKGR